MFVEHNKETIADLERQKIALKDQLEFETKTSRIIKLEEQLYEVEDTIKKLTQPVRPAWRKNLRSPRTVCWEIQCSGILRLLLCFTLVWLCGVLLVDNLYFIIGISAIIYFSYKLGKDRGTYLASEKAVDMMIAMGFLATRNNGEEIIKIKDIEDDSSK